MSPFSTHMERILKVQKRVRKPVQPTTGYNTEGETLTLYPFCRSLSPHFISSGYRRSSLSLGLKQVFISYTKSKCSFVDDFCSVFFCFFLKWVYSKFLVIWMHMVVLILFFYFWGGDVGHGHHQSEVGKGVLLLCEKWWFVGEGWWLMTWGTLIWVELCGKRGHAVLGFLGWFRICKCFVTGLGLKNEC